MAFSLLELVGAPSGDSLSIGLECMSDSLAQDSVPGLCPQHFLELLSDLGAPLRSVEADVALHRNVYGQRLKKNRGGSSVSGIVATSAKPRRKIVHA